MPVIEKYLISHLTVLKKYAIIKARANHGKMVAPCQILKIAAYWGKAGRLFAFVVLVAVKCFICNHNIADCNDKLKEIIPRHVHRPLSGAVD